MRLRRLKSAVALFTAAVLLAVVVFDAVDLWLRYGRALQVAETRARNLTIALSEYVRGTFAAVDSSLRQLALHGQRIGGSSGPAGEWMPILDAARAALNDSGSLSVTGPNGIIRHSTLKEIVGQPRADNYLFRHFVANDSDAMIVDEPFPSPVFPGVMVLPVGRRLETADNRFDGLVVAVIAPDVFRTFFRTVNIGREGSITVFHPNGIVLVREPSDRNPLGEKVPNHPVLAAARDRGSTGVFTGALEPGGPDFITGYGTLAAPPLIVSVSLSRSEVLADWREQARNTVLELLALAGVFGVLLVFLVRQVEERSRVQRELAAVQRTEAERLREANEQLEGALSREKHAREDAEAANRLKDEFLMTLSHELRTPLNAIVGWTRMLSTDVVPADERPRAMATIERNANSLARLVEDLLDVSRAISGKLYLQTRPVSVTDAVIAAAETLRPAIDAKQIDFDMDVDPTLEPILADPDRLQQIVWNLLSNAIKFTRPGGRVTLRAACTESGIEIVVRDTGAGIAPTFLPFVFERFRQADAGVRREHGGLGLGLAIARHLVELHGGTITAESDGPGAGATFRIVLPASAQPSRASMLKAEC